MKGKILNIQRCSIHNGPGIRTTVFFKGCPMTCLWCHNPESQSFKNEIMYDNEKCTNCQNCINSCLNNCIELNNDKIITNLDNCILCEKCIDHCVSGARELVGRDINPRDLVHEVMKDQEFFKNSNGGVTLSGGEALNQGEFTIEIARLLKKRGVSVALDTCGFVSKEHLEKISQYIDIFLYDIKIIDSKKHLEFTGVDNKLIFENLKLLSSLSSRIFIRIPLIEGINTSDAEIQGILDLIDGINVEKISLLPYHEIGKHKYNKLNLNFKNKVMKVPNKDLVEKIKKIFEKKYTVEIGG
ncbi:MAG: glycyl-radical enzyme activating protein [Psychrilyobacter sp.]|uniref:glycyl-radical enzyme activating protein n=1 Tax=Psychrilyobacter sp. TaxID=2586924 RepID=UPI003C72D2D6